MTKKLMLFFSITVTSFLLLSQSRTSAVLSPGVYSFADEIRVGSEYEWTIKQLENLEEVYGSVEDFYIDDIQLVEGAIIKLVVRAEPNSVYCCWYDLFVDDVEVSSPTNISVGYAPFYMYTYPNYFISPIQYSNDTGTYNYFELIYESYLENVYTIIEYTGLPIYTEEFQLRKIGNWDDSSITAGLEILESRLEVNPDGSEYYEYFSFDVSHTINTDNGLLLENHANIDYETYEKAANGTILFHEQYYNHYLIELNPEPSSFSWMISFFGLSTFGVITFIVKKRR
jgi:hypothetical protein